jgi:hypothetical protein
MEIAVTTDMGFVSPCSEMVDNSSLLHLIRGLEAYSFTAVKIVAAFVLVSPTQNNLVF